MCMGKEYKMLVKRVSMSSGTTHSQVFSPTALTESENDKFEWYRGQLHAHTNVHDKSDVVQWYKQHGYDFAAVTDLNYATPVGGLKSVYDEPEQFLVMQGIETSTYYEGAIHDVMGYGGTPQKVRFDSVVSTVRDDFFEPETTQQPAESRGVTVPSEPAKETYKLQTARLSEAGCLPAIAHPNLTWAAGAEEILSVDPGVLSHFEMITTEPGMNDKGGGDHPSTMEIWDKVLSTGRTLYAIAADDSHHFERFGPEKRPVEGEMKTYAPSLPGRTSVFVRAQELSSNSILDGLRRGDFYSVKHELTLPIVFEKITVNENKIELQLPTDSKDIGWTSSIHNPTRYRTSFIGIKGDANPEIREDESEVLKIDESNTPSYSFTGSELYVRARVDGSDGAVAWTQPVFLNKRD